MIEKLLEDFLYVGDFIEKSDSVNLIGFRREKGLAPKFMSDKRGRVYIFVEEKEADLKILKIGKSSGKSGMTGTLSLYYTALSGTPGPNRYCLHHLISQKIKSGSNIKVFVKHIDSVKQKIKGLNTELELEIPLDITYVEELCRNDYYNIFNQYPEWNFQERNEEMPANLHEAFGNFIAEKNKNKNEKMYENTNTICGWEN